MGFRDSRRWLPLLTLSLLGGGCAELSAWRGPPQSRPTVAAHDPRPPAPAPALYIAGTPIESTSEFKPSDDPASLQGLGQTDVVADLPELVPVSSIPLATEATTANSPLAPLRTLQKDAAEHLARMDGYTARLRRREVINGKRRPEELILCTFRREPWSMHLKWIGEEAFGRQAIYAKGQHDDAFHLLAANQRLKMTLDSAWLKANSRHPITSAGIGPLIEQFGQLIDRSEKSAAAVRLIRDLGVLKRPELEQPVHAILQSIPPRSDELLPKGGQRLWFFDTVHHLPVLIITHDHIGMEVEYYCYQEIQPASALADDDFDPQILWRK